MNSALRCYSPAPRGKFMRYNPRIMIACLCFSIRPIATVALLTAATMLAACSSSGPELTATAVYDQARVELQNLRSTATVERARMKTTLDYVGTRVRQVEDAGQFLRSNLISLNTDTNFIATNISLILRAPTLTAKPSPTPTVRDLVDAVTPIAPPTPVPIAAATQPGTNNPATEDDDRPRLENVVMASGVYQNDCAIDVNPVFTPESGEIYIVAEAYNISVGSTISTRWQRKGIEVAYFSFQAENDIHGSCIWFFIDQTDTAFIEGSWSVEIRVDDITLGSPIAFQIVSS